jgi:hypothetical protein
MIEADAFGLGSSQLVESSEQGMLAQAARAQRQGERHRLPRLGAASDERQSSR